MKKLLMLLVLSVFVLSVSSAAIAQEKHGEEHPAEAAEGEHGEAHGDTPLQTAFKWVNFAILFGGLTFLLRKPMSEFFQARRAAITSGLQRAQDAQSSAHARMDEIEQRLSSLSAEVAALKSEAESESQADREKILAEAKAEVNRVVEQSRQEVERYARGVEREIKEKVADVVIDRAGNTLRRQMTEDDQKRVVVRFIKKL